MKSVAFWIIFLVSATITSSFKRHSTINLTNVNKDTYSVYIIKSEYELKVYDSTGEWIASYPVVFGSKDLGDKMMKGDKKTPEGIFHIVGKRKHEKWNRFMSIDYPNETSFEKFRQRKADGLVPQNAQIGGEIGIHGTWPHEDYAIDQYRNWTEGCVSTKNQYIQELFNLLPVGTRVEIRP